MAAELHGGPFHRLGGECRQMLADRDRTRERNLAHIVLGDQVLGDARRHAENQVQHTRRQAGVGKAAHDLDAGAGGFFRGLEDQRAASGERAADLARRRQRREIPRRERGHDADRFLDDELADLAAPRHDPAIGAAAFFRIPLDDVGRGEHFGARFRVGFALLLDQHFADPVMPLAHEIGRLAQDFRPVIGRGRAPHREALLGRFQRAIEIGRAGMRQMRQRLFRRRIDHVLAAAAVAIEPLTVDVKFQVGVHEGPLWGFSRKGDSRRFRPDFRFVAGAVSLARDVAGFRAAFIPGLACREFAQ